MQRLLGGAIAAFAWFGLGLQLVLIVAARPGEAAIAIVNFFSFFTILSNILVALLTTARVAAPNLGIGRFFARPAVAASVTLYIAVTGIIYFTILRHLWDPEGLAFVADALLHYATPLLFLIYWLAFLPKGVLGFGDLPKMLVFPLVYVVYSLIRGAITGTYPYPFISVVDLGYPQTLLNILGMTAVFSVCAGLLVLIDRALGPRSQAR